MMKSINIALIVLALSVCVLSTEIVFNINCAYHYAYGNESYTEYEVYGMMKEGTPIYELYRFPTSSSLIRCDIAETDESGKERCFGVFKAVNEPQQEQFESKEGYIPSVFDYDTVQEEGVFCPSNSSATECKKYCNSTQKVCYILDSEKHVLAVVYGDGQPEIVSWFDDGPSLHYFTTSLNNHTELPYPENVCSPPGEIDLQVKCAYHYTYRQPDMDECEVYGIMKDGRPLYEYWAPADPNETTSLIRYDVTEERDGVTRYFCVYRKNDGSCDKHFEKAEWEDLVHMEYDAGPYDVANPDKRDPKRCQKYCNGHEERCIIVDTYRRVVGIQYRMRQPTLLIWHDDVPSLDMFDDYMCNTTKLPDPVDVCEPLPRIDLKQDCLYHYLVGDEESVEYEVYGMLKGDLPIYEFYRLPGVNDTTLIRCDFNQTLPNGRRRCLGIYREEKCDPHYESDDNPSLLHFEYTSGPENVSCPLNSTAKDCKKYCNTEKEKVCYYVDPDMRVVGIQYRERKPTVYVRLTDTFSLDIFDDYMCNSTKLPDHVNYCPTISSSKASSTTTHSSKVSPTIISVDPVSSASTVKASLVIAAILLLFLF